MKVLIWFLCLFANATITTIIKENGVILGGIPTALLFIVAAFLAQTLCKQWDKYKANKSLKASMQNAVFCKKCGERLIDNSNICGKCGTEASITDNNINDGSRCERCGADITHDKEYCHGCYKKLSETKSE